MEIISTIEQVLPLSSIMTLFAIMLLILMGDIPLDEDDEEEEESLY